MHTNFMLGPFIISEILKLEKKKNTQKAYNVEKVKIFATLSKSQKVNKQN